MGESGSTGTHAKLDVPLVGPLNDKWTGFDGWAEDRRGSSGRGNLHIDVLLLKGLCLICSHSYEVILCVQDERFRTKHLRLVGGARGSRSRSF